MNEIEELDLIHSITADARMTLLTECSTTHHYQLPSGIVDVFIEFLQPPLPLIVFGAGESAKPLVQFAKALGWQVTVVDCRANEASYTRFSMSDRVILTRREKLSQEVNIDRHTVAIVMTHNYLDDLAILQWLLPSSIRYLGLMGAKKRSDRLLQELSLGDGVQRQKLYAPVGLDIGANTPEEIALAIIAEIQAVLKKRSGGFLKDRQGAIHGHCEVLCPSV